MVKVSKKPMFHVKQFDFEARFHVKLKPPKTHQIVGFWVIICVKTGIYCLSPCKKL